MRRRKSLATALREHRACIEAHVERLDALAESITDDQIRELRMQPTTPMEVRVACARALNEFGLHSSDAVWAARVACARFAKRGGS